MAVDALADKEQTPTHVAEDALAVAPCLDRNVLRGRANERTGQVGRAGRGR